MAKGDLPGGCACGRVRIEYRLQVLIQRGVGGRVLAEPLARRLHV
jgi:hypothetical protein